MAGKRRWARMAPYLLIAPAVGILIAVLIYPTFYNIYLSFWNWRLIAPDAREFIGLGNYWSLFFEDQRFWGVLGFTFTFTAASVVGIVGLGVLAGVILNSLKWGRQVFTSIFLLPFMIAPIAVGLIWRLIWSHEVGIVNYLLTLVGFESPPVWLGSSLYAPFAVIISEIWRSSPFGTLVILAALTAIPLSLFEAARVDGATSWKQFVYITLPLIKPALAIVFIFQTIFLLRIFDIIYTLTGGGPGISTTPIGILLYRTYFRYLEGGYASAMSVFLLIVGGVLSLFYIRLLYREEEY